MSETLHKATFELTQDGNCMGSTSENEMLSVTLDDPTLNGEFFFVLRTEGWSIDSPEDFAALLVDLQDRCRATPTPEKP